jgi:hypothetical protein
VFGAATAAAPAAPVGLPFQFGANAANAPANSFTTMALPKFNPPMQSLQPPAQMAFPPMMPTMPQFGTQPQIPVFNSGPDGSFQGGGGAAADAGAAFNVGTPGRKIAKARGKK